MKKRISNICTYAFLIVASFLSVFPMYYMLSSATNKSTDVLKGTIIPGAYFFTNLSSITESGMLIVAMKNSTVNAVLLTLLALVVCSIAGYGFEIYHDKGKDFVMNILLVAMFLPFAATLVPLFKMFGQMDLMSTTAAVILPTISTPFLIMMFRQSARSFPSDIIEAGRLDGLSEVGIFFRIFIPTMKSTYAAAAVITFMNAWNNYLWPRVILRTPESQTMTMFIANMKSGYVTDYGALMLAVSLCTIPTIIVFFVMQKSFTEGITGSVK